MLKYHKRPILSIRLQEEGGLSGRWVLKWTTERGAYSRPLYKPEVGPRGIPLGREVENACNDSRITGPTDEILSIPVVSVRVPTGSRRDL